VAGGTFVNQGTTTSPGGGAGYGGFEALAPYRQNVSSLLLHSTTVVGSCHTIACMRSKLSYPIFFVETAPLAFVLVAHQC